MHTLRTYFARTSDSPSGAIPEPENVREMAREEAKRIADWNFAARDLFARAKEGAKHRDIDFALPSPDFLVDLAEAQKGRCALTGLRMLPKEPAESEGLPSDECWRRFAPSVDRIRSDGHYTRDNVQLTCVFANVGKAEADDANFKRFLTCLATDPTDTRSDVAEMVPLRPLKRKLPTRGDVVKRKREVDMLLCDAKERKLRLTLSMLPEVAKSASPTENHVAMPLDAWTSESDIVLSVQSWIRSKYELYDGDILNEYGSISHKSNGERVVAWDWKTLKQKAGDGREWFVKFSKLFQKYNSFTGGSVKITSVRFAKILTSMNLGSAVKKIDGEVCQVRIGIRKRS
ncbi:hypothetical protein CYMTET_5324 [Cymbomonas tetramitiformis]|uniref:Uncharacterized protein n=1 Tax=Cymbomonas tetramitiformis TaxID=36881 RepID=A0AAE0GZN3_9CHLO|nr:hypothetical protein CYMTET_5324 [Cymbomonas tetramitiformis]